MNSDKDKNQKYKRLIADTLIFAMGNLGSKIILFFMVPLYTNYLTKEEYGTSDLVFTVAQLLVPFVSLVIFDAVLRFGLANNANKENVLKSSFVVIAIGSIVTIAFTPFIQLYNPLSEWRWYLCLYVILTLISNVEMNYIKLIGHNKEYAIISVFHTFVLAVANVIFLVKLHLGIKGYLLATIMGCLTTVVLATFAGRIISALKRGIIERPLLYEMIRFSTPLILNNVSWWIIQSSDKIMIEAMVGATALGLYTTATKIPSLINVIISIFSQSWGISSVKEYESSNEKGFYSKIFVSYSTLSFGAVICINSIVKPFMYIYVSNSFFESWRFVPLLLVSAAFSAVASYFGSLYGALKKSVNNMRSTLCAAIINIIVNYIGIILFDTWGAIIGTVVAYFILAMYRMIDVLKYIKFDPKWGNYIINVILAFVQAICVLMGFHIYSVSIMTICIYIIVNRFVICKLFHMILKMINRK